MIASGVSTASRLPWCSTAMRCARPVTTSMRCSTISTVLPSPCTDPISSTSSGTSSIETPANGSSSRITRGCPASSIASSSLRLSPCESRPACACAREPKPTRSSAHPARSTASVTRSACRQMRIVPPSAASAASRTFSNTERSGKTFETWKVRPRPARVRRNGGSPVMSEPSSSTRPDVGRSRPEMRLNSVVLPAPFGPITASSSPSRTSSPTPETIVAPPMTSPRSLVARIGGALTRGSFLLALHRHDWWRGVVAADRSEHLRDEMAAALHELHAEHRLQRRMVLRPDRLEALRAEELEALERGDHLVDVVVALLQRLDEHERGVETVGREDVRHLALLAHLRDEPVVHLVLRSGVDVVRQEVDLRRLVAQRRPRRALGEPRDDVRAVEHVLLVERLPHRAGRRACPRDEDQVGVRVLRLLGEGREVGRRERHRDLRHGVTLRADERLDRGVVAVTEDGVLVEDDDLLAGALEEAVDRLHVLERLAPRAERVLVDPRNPVVCRRAGDEEHLVLGGERRDLERDAGRLGAHDDLVALADQILRRVDGRRRVRLVVDEGEVDRLAVDLVGALRRVVEAELEPLDVLAAVGREQPGA